MSVVESDGPPSWSLDASATGESTNCLWVGEMGFKAWIFLVCRALHHPYPRAFCTLPSFACIKRPRWRPVGLNDRHLRSNGKIGDCEQSKLHVASYNSNLLQYFLPWFDLTSLNEVLFRIAWTRDKCMKQCCWVCKFSNSLSKGIINIPSASFHTSHTAFTAKWHKLISRICMVLEAVTTSACYIHVVVVRIP